ncbi:MAG: serine/threonine protein kinase, partial [Gemmataceae bacterium]|nr:serine/threonine protein kinase [Gemmataceae bacterium]
MPAPATVPELTDRLRKSGLVPPDRLDGFLAGLRASGRSPADPGGLLERLVDAGMITRFHAGKLAAGKYKGFHLGSYLILDQLGAGGMGQVFLAEHAAMRRLVAVKVLSVAAADDPVARERFAREARAAGTLDHPNVVRVFDLCQDGRLFYLVMEYVDGISLQGLVGRAGPLPVGAACHYARQVLFGLGHAHAAGLVHRDIKPANLLVDRAGVVKILDLGLVRSDADGAEGLTKLLDNKTVLGTADYVAPEQAVDSSAVDARADLYSLGATLYFLLTGRPLFPDGRAAQKLIWQQTRDPARLDHVRPDVPPGLAGVVHTLLAKKPEDRYETAAEAFDALAPWDPGEVPPPADDLLPPPVRLLAGRALSAGAGGTSQVLALAMKSGGGLSGERMLPGGGPGGSKPGSFDSSADTDA